MIVALVQFLYYISCHHMLTFLFRARVDLAALRLEQLRRPLIIAANHPSRLDPFLLVLLPFGVVRRIVPFHILTAAIYYDRWWIGPLVRWIGAYRLPPVAWTVEDYLGGSLEQLSRGRSILLFPEGRLTGESQERRAKPGIAQLALRTGTPILPLRLQVAGEVRPRNILCRRVAVHLTVGPVIEVTRREPTRDTADQLAQQVLQTIRALV
jgi:1-acyl-sn-glycerol-3-phosphate acyltransferase